MGASRGRFVVDQRAITRKRTRTLSIKKSSRARFHVRPRGRIAVTQNCQCACARARLLTNEMMSSNATFPALTNTFQELADNSWLSRRVSAMEPELPRLLRIGYDANAQYTYHMRRLRQLWHACAEPLKGLFDSEAVEPLVRLVLEAAMLAPGDPQQGEVADREGYTALTLHTLLDLMLPVRALPPGCIVADAVRQFCPIPTVICNPATGREWLVLAREGGRKALRRVFACVAEHEAFFRSCAAAPDSLHVIALSFSLFDNKVTASKTLRLADLQAELNA